MECYRRSDELVQMVNEGLKRKFEPIINYLYKIRRNEELKPEEGCLGNSPFTSLSLTKNYNCAVHTDVNDISYSFFIWLGQDGKLIVLYFVT